MAVPAGNFLAAKAAQSFSYKTPLSKWQRKTLGVAESKRKILQPRGSLNQASERSRKGQSSQTISQTPRLSYQHSLHQPLHRRIHSSYLRTRHELVRDPCPIWEHNQTLSPVPHSGTLTPKTWKTKSQINQSGKDGGAGEVRDNSGNLHRHPHGMLQSLGPKGQGHSPEGQLLEEGKHPPLGNTPFQREIGISTSSKSKKNQRMKREGERGGCVCDPA